MLHLEVILAAESHTESLTIDGDIEHITLETDPDCPTECDETLWNWISSHFAAENRGLDGETAPMYYDENGVCERDGVRYYRDFASFIEH